MEATIFEKKLDPQSKHNLEAILEEVAYTCGIMFEEINFPDDLKSVCVKYHCCKDPMKKLYYSSGYSPICYYCGADVDDDPDSYPQCELCISKPPVRNLNF